MALDLSRKDVEDRVVELLEDDSEITYENQHIDRSCHNDSQTSCNSSNSIDISELCESTNLLLNKNSKKNTFSISNTKRRNSITQWNMPFENKPKRSCSVDNLLNEVLSTSSSPPSAVAISHQDLVSLLLQNDKLGKVKKSCAATCRDNCNANFTEDERKKIHNDFWSITEVALRRKYIVDLMEKTQPKRTQVRDDGKRGYNFAYHFIKNGRKIKVCKHFFCNTLVVSGNLIRYAWMKAEESITNTEESTIINRKTVQRRYVSTESILNDCNNTDQNLNCTNNNKSAQKTLNVFKSFKLKLNQIFKK